MLSISLCLIGLFVVFITHWVYRWKNPKCNGTLPPGSMGFPLIGETIQFALPSNSLGIPPFIKKRMQRYGPLFRTSLAGRPVIISTDPEISNFILQQEGKLVEFWYMDANMKLLGQKNSETLSGYVHKYLKNLIVNHFGLERLKERLIPMMEKKALEHIRLWTTEGSIDTKKAISAMTFSLSSKLLFSYDDTKSTENIGEKLAEVIQGLMSFPLNIPGTTFHRSLKKQKMMIKTIRDIVKQRCASPETRQGDLLDDLIEDMKKESFVTEDFIVYMIFAMLIAASETVSSTLTSAIKLLTDHPSVVKELTDEHEAIINKRENADSSITWTEYKSMNITSCVLNEALRLTTIGPGILRRALKDFNLNGYTIPKGWTVLVPTAGHNLNPQKFEDPLVFNPYRWKSRSSSITPKDFIAFGLGIRACPGSEYSRVLMAIFFHFLVTKYRWVKVKGAKGIQVPTLGIGNSFHIQVSEKQN